MNNSKSTLIIGIVLFVISVALVFIGQKNIGYTGLGLEIIGLIGILVVLHLYNRQYK